jgi:hypothetical protein
MREWLFVIAPLTVVLYFLAFPGQLGPTFDWVTSATHWVMASL